jgi:hypothetical protein
MRFRGVGCFVLVAGSALAQGPAAFAISGNWEVTVQAPGSAAQVVHVAPPSMLTVTAERYLAVPVFNPKASGWVKGAQLRGVKAQETTSPYLLDPASFVLREGPEAGSAAFTRGTDFEIDTAWGTFGRLAAGRIGADQSVFASYRHAQMRLDAVVVSRADRSPLGRDVRHSRYEGGPSVEI